MTLRDLLVTLRRRWIVIVVLTAFCVGIATVYAFSQPQKNYASSATIAFLPDPGQSSVAPPESMTTLLATYAVIAQSQENAEETEEILGHPPTGSITATTASDSLVLAISSEASSPEAAAETARAATSALLPTIREGGVVVPRVVNHPLASGSPIESRSPKLIIGVAAVLGLIAGVLLALLLENLGGFSGAPAAPAKSSESLG